MNRVLSWAGQLLSLLVLTFLFVVLFAHGTSDFGRHAQEEFSALVGWLRR